MAAAFKNHTWLAVASILVGTGLGTTLPIFNATVQMAFQRKDLGAVLSTLKFIRNIGGTAGAAALGAIRLATLSDDPAIEERLRQFVSLNTVFIGGASLAVLGFFIALIVRPAAWRRWGVLAPIAQ